MAAVYSQPLLPDNVAIGVQTNLYLLNLVKYRLSLYVPKWNYLPRQFDDNYCNKFLYIFYPIVTIVLNLLFSIAYFAS